jgi:MoxR-like ATPase
MLTRLSSAPVPFRVGSAWEEIERIWDGLDTEGRKQMLAHARALAEVDGRLPAPLDDRQLVLPC